MKKILNFLGDELVFKQFKTSELFSSPQDYDLTLYFDGAKNTSELTRKEIWSVTCNKTDLKIEDKKNYFKVFIDKKATLRLNATVKIYGFKLKVKSADNHSSSAQNIEISWTNSLILMMAFCIYRIFL